MLKILIKGVIIMAITGNLLAGTPKIVSMDFFPNNARAVFEIDVDSSAKIEIPGSFDYESIRLTDFKGQSPDVTYLLKKVVYKDAVFQGELKELYAKLEKKYAQLIEVNAKISAAEENTKLVASAAENISQTNSQIEFMKFLMESNQKNTLDKNRLGIEKIRIEKEYNTLEQEFKSRVPNNLDKAISVEIAVKNSGKIYLEATTSQAGWKAHYKMDLNSKTNKIKSIFYALAYQKTGTDYSGVINFYSQNPNRGIINVVTPEPLIVNFAENAINNMFSETSSADFLMPVSKSKSAAPIVKETPVNFSITANGAVKGDGGESFVELVNTVYGVDTNFYLYGVYSPNALITANISKIKEPFLSGTAELYTDGDFAGKTFIKNHSRGEDIRIAFGETSFVTLTKIVNIPKSGTGGIFTSGSMFESYVLKVRNGLERQIDIEIVDRIPYSVVDKISIDNIKITPAADVNYQNVLTWKLKLEASEEKKIDVEYRIKYPSDKNITFN